MRPNDALDGLAPAYREALRLARSGAPDEAIAAATGVEPEAVPALVQLAEAKLAGRQGPSRAASPTEVE